MKFTTTIAFLALAVYTAPTVQQSNGEHEIGSQKADTPVQNASVANDQAGNNKAANSNASNSPKPKKVSETELNAKDSINLDGPASQKPVDSIQQEVKSNKAESKNGEANKTVQQNPGTPVQNCSVANNQPGDDKSANSNASNSPKPKKVSETELNAKDSINLDGPEPQKPSGGNKQEIKSNEVEQKNAEAQGVNT